MTAATSIRELNIHDLHIGIAAEVRRLCLSAFRVTEADISSPSRKIDIAKCRFAIMYFTQGITQATCVWVAQHAIPGHHYHHTSVLHGVQDIRDLIATQDIFYYPLLLHIAAQLKYPL